jgi:hypothetical protein
MTGSHETQSDDFVGIELVNFALLLILVMGAAFLYWIASAFPYGVSSSNKAPWVVWGSSLLGMFLAVVAIRRTGRMPKNRSAIRSRAALAIIFHLPVAAIGLASALYSAHQWQMRSL